MKKTIIMLSLCALCLGFTGCAANETVAVDDVETADNMENGLSEMEPVTLDIMENGLPEMEPVVEDNWPERIGRENDNTTAQNLSFDIEISNPMTLSLACVTESGKLDLEIKRHDGETVFHERDIQTENFTVSINAEGTYNVIMQADNHTGSFWIEPQE